jgi:hypothetical protein
MESLLEIGDALRKSRVSVTAGQQSPAFSDASMAKSAASSWQCKAMKLTAAAYCVWGKARNGTSFSSPRAWSQLVNSERFVNQLRKVC